MSLVPRYRLWLLIVALLAVTTYAAADVNPLLFLFAAPALIISWWITEGPPPRAMPRLVVNALVLGVVARALADSLGDEGFRVEVFADFVVLLLIVKMLDRRRPRDGAQVLVLAAFLVIGAVLTSNAFEVGLLMLLFVPAVVLGVLLHQLAVTASGPAGPFAPHAEHPPRAVVASHTLRRLLSDLSRLTALICLFGVALAAGVFVLMPRGFGVAAFGDWGGPAVGRVSGFNDEVALGSGGLISQSQEPVLDLQVFDPDGRSLGAAARRFYLRGAVLDRYEDGVWSRRRNERTHQSQRQGPVFLGSDRLNISGAPRDWTLEQRYSIRNAGAAGGGAFLFSLWRPLALETKQPYEILWDQTDGEMRLLDHRGRFEYVVFSRPSTPRPPDPADPAPPDEAATGEDPPEPITFPSEPIAELAQTLAVPSDDDPGRVDPRRTARAVEQHFSDPQYRYTLETLSAPPGRDPIEWFLFDNREGHCEYFASAMAALCRSLGLDARVVTGYVAADYNETTEHYVVRAANAHAWVEVETEPGVWITYDPTPDDDFDRIHEPSTGLFAQLRSWLDAVEFAWIRNVVSYDGQARAELLGLDPRQGDRFNDVLARAFDRVQRGGRTAFLQALLRGVIVFAAVTAAGAVIVSLRHGGWRNILAALGSLFASRASARRLADRIDRILDRSGDPRPSWKPLLTHGDAVAEAWSAETAAALRRLLHAYAALRFSPPQGAPNTPNADALDADLRALRAAVRRRLHRPDRGATPENPA